MAVTGWHRRIDDPRNTTGEGLTGESTNENVVDRYIVDCDAADAPHHTLKKEAIESLCVSFDLDMIDVVTSSHFTAFRRSHQRRD